MWPRLFKNCLDIILKAQSRKEQTDKLYFLKRFLFRSYCHEKKKRQAAEIEKIFVQHISGKGLLSKTFKKCSKLCKRTSNSKKKNGQRI